MKQLNWAHYIAGQAGVCGCSKADPGTGKTKSHESLARKTGRYFYAAYLDQELPEDAGGVPALGKFEHNGTIYDVFKKHPHEEILRCYLEPSIILVDELTNASASIQAAWLRRIQDGIPGCWMYAACNPIESAANPVDLTKPFVNRIWMGEWEVDRETILEGWQTGGQNFQAPDFPILPGNWQDFCPKWGALVSRFAGVKPDLMQQCPSDVAKGGEPWPSWRSWTNGIHLLGAGESVAATNDTMSKLLRGVVGDGAAGEFLTWVSTQDLPDPEMILKNPSKLKLPVRGDLAITVLASIINRIRLNNTPERWEACRDVIEVAYTQQPEAAMSAEAALLREKPANHKPKARNSKVAKEIQANRLAGA